MIFTTKKSQSAAVGEKSPRTCKDNQNRIIILSRPTKANVSTKM